MDDEALKLGKARVQEHLIGPLELRGLRRGARVTVEAHEAFLDDLRARLAYMPADALAALAEVIEGQAEGPRRDRWPSGVAIWKWATRLAPPPESDSRLVRSYLASAAGAAAEAGGWLPELYDHLKKFGMPPNDFAVAQMKRAAGDAERRLARLRDEEARGCADPADRAWAAWRANALSRARAVIDRERAA